MSEDLGEQLDGLDELLDTHNYPTTTNELIENYGDYEVETLGGWKSLGEVLTPLTTKRTSPPMTFDFEYRS